MTPLVNEWIEKAEADFATAGREIRARKSLNYDAVCFHAQQCAEKYLKALLQQANISFPKTHNLLEILDLILTIDPTWELFRPNLALLTSFAVNLRYPGESADKATAQNALALCRAVRSKARLTLRLKP